MKIKILSYSLAAGMAMGLAPVQAQTTHHHKAGLTDALFAKKAAAGGLTEVTLGQLAEQNGASQEVKDFGAKMVTDHGKANDGLKAIASKDSLTIPDKPNAEQQALIDKLTKETGKEFDSNYIRAMVRAHIADKALFTEEADNAKNQDLKVFAQDTLPVITEHLSMIESIAGNGDSHQSAATQGGDMPAMGSSGESKSGLAPGSNANPVPDTTTDTSKSTGNGMPTTPDTGSSGESKSGLAPGSNANPVPVTPQ
jgi:putative membrane protein